MRLTNVKCILSFKIIQGGGSVLEAEMKDIFFWYLDEKYMKVRVIEEKVIGKSRADVVAVLPDSIIGFEIKSDSDSYQRLPKQIKFYDKFFDHNYIVVGKTHRRSVGEFVPEHWGIICIFDDENGKPRVEVLREAALNKKCKMRWQLSFLWRSELSHIQTLNNLYKYANKSKLYVIKYLIEKVEPPLLKEQLCEELFERDYILYEEE